MKPNKDSFEKSELPLRRAQRTAKIVPNMITAFGLMCGLFIIFKTNMIEVGGSTFEAVQIAAILLILAAIADLLDGAAARAFHAITPFGCVFDSMADAVTFGVAPSVVMLKSLSIQPGTFLSFIATCGAMTFSICGILRLVRYNTEPPAELLEPGKMQHFTGMPIPSAAMASLSFNLLLISPSFLAFFTISDVERTWLLSTVMVLIGYLMICRWKFPSLKALRFRLPSFQFLFFAVIIAVFIFFGLIYHFPVVFFGMVWSYLLIAVCLSGYRIIAGRRNRILEEFEPETEFDELE